MIAHRAGFLGLCIAASMWCSTTTALAQDCNSNGIPDADDIASGTSQDCNTDGIPDECQPALDSDGDGIPDSCQPILNMTQGDYHTDLQEAVDDADSGDVLELEPIAHWVGANFFNLHVYDKSLTIRGQDPGDEDVVRSTFIDARSVVYRPGSVRPDHALNLVGVRFRSILVDPFFDRAGSSVLLDRCWVEGDGAGPDNGVYASDPLGQMIIRNTTICNLTTAVAAGGIGSEAVHLRQVRIEQSRIVHCFNGVFMSGSSGNFDTVFDRQALIIEGSLIDSIGGSALYFSPPYVYPSEGIGMAELQVTNTIIRSGSITVQEPSKSNVSYDYDFRHCNILGGVGQGDQVIDADPMYVDADGADDDPLTVEDNDYRLSEGSPCIDAGNWRLYDFSIIDFDFDGADRIQGAEADIGPYEFASGPPCLADTNGDGLLNFFDVAEYINLFSAGCP